ncbi:hypothetical protein VW23_022610 [Devosia insulae DS-56]|uniref:HTH luxR-type domain-containing protein n=1 Tax=Devosia insulae DS-56 TaxID=1116389 RepID=A0A1E5XNJ6_9HYPH|nr:LuxR C-terminal-related transcriptional regulator [Devosia insulae]OEO30177.1 hypothetical protein VW23_022610 [Devosia insulae DS-56]
MDEIPDTDSDFWNPLELLDRTRGVTADQAWSVLDAALTRAGFPHSFFASGVPMTSKRPLLDKFERGIFGGGRFVGEFFPELIRQPQLLATEPVAPHCRRSLRPLVWSSEAVIPTAGSAMALARDFDLSAFIVFPLRNADATRYGNFTVFRSDAGRQASWLRRAQRLGPLLHVTAQYFHDTLAGLEDGAPDASSLVLSPRQRECLLWASQGLSSKRIADRLALSEPVVNEYLATARRKLGTSTRTHAVARAIALGLIDP